MNGDAPTTGGITFYISNQSTHAQSGNYRRQGAFFNFQNPTFFAEKSFPSRLFIGRGERKRYNGLAVFHILISKTKGGMLWQKKKPKDMI